MASVQELEKKIKKIEERNKLVEADKAWETSTTRKVITAVFTYLAISLYLWAINIPLPFQNALVPTIGFLLSMLTFPAFKKIWLKSYNRK